ncbi:MAG: UbiA family prenyltransferase, partial [Sulfolobales archaeon]
MRIRDILQLVRIHNVLGSSIGAITGFLIASNWALDKLQYLILSAAIVGLTSAGGYVINDIYDIEIDKINKPKRPLPSGKVSIKEAWYITIVFFSISIISSVFLNNTLLI